MTRRISTIVFLLLIACSVCLTQRRVGKVRTQMQAPAITQSIQVDHVFWIWFENREISALTAASAPNFHNFSTTYANFTTFSASSTRRNRTIWTRSRDRIRA